MRWRLNKKKAFSLAELLLAVSITSLVLGIIYSTYFNVTNTIGRLRQKIKVYKTAVICLERIKQDLSGAYYSDNKGALFIGKKDTLKFVSTHFLGAKDVKGLVNIEYSLLPAEGGKYTLCRSEDGNRFCFGEYFKKVDFSYKKERGWASEWNSGDMGRLPFNVKTSIIIAIGENPPQEFSLTFKIPCAR